jgi:hypothetical protein
MEANFSGYATKAGLECADGRTIMPDAFKHQDKIKVPLVWHHGHDDAENVLGHAILENRADGVYAYGFFNGTPKGQHAKSMVEHGDIEALSIYANKLVERGKKVFHGFIKEVSLVLSGANPGARIEAVNIQHGDDTIELDDEVLIWSGETLEHGFIDVDAAVEEEDDDNLQHAEGEEETVQDVYDSLNPKQKNVVHFMIGAAIEQRGASAEHSDVKNNKGDLAHKEGNDEMTTRNIFEQDALGAAKGPERKYLSHDDVRSIVSNAQKLGSLKDAVEDYALKHGIDNIEVLFPDAQTVDAMPQFNKRRTEWVQGVLNGTRHSPFSRVKTMWADITQAEARARGYIKGHYKYEEWFNVTKRVTTPTTIYKKQRLDRDDVVDITTMDVVAWVKQEMRIMLDEELARAVLLGDGREVSDEDKIKDPMGAPAGDGIRSIYHDHELFVTTINVNVDDANSSYDEVVDAVMDGMEYYKGTGTPTFYTTIRQLNKFLKAKDGMQRRLYNNKAEVAAALGVDSIVTVEPMNDYAGLIGIIVNLDDYTIGADKGGEVTTFEDFDIDYNQQKYLIETRLSGGLTRIKSAIVVKSTGASDTLLAKPTVPTYVASTGVVTIPTMTHVTYKNADTGATLSSGAQSALAVGATLNVQALADSGYYFANDADTLWPFFRRA